MSQTKKAVISGAFGDTGGAVAQELVRRGWTVLALTNRTTPPGCKHISAAPLRLDRLHDVIAQDLASDILLTAQPDGSRLLSLPVAMPWSASRKREEYCLIAICSRTVDTAPQA